MHRAYTITLFPPTASLAAEAGASDGKEENAPVEFETPIREIPGIFASKYPGSYGVLQAEQCPQTGRHHVHVFLDVHGGSPIRFSSLKRWLESQACWASPHIEAVRSRKRTIDYCRKDESRRDGPYYWPSQSEFDTYYEELSSQGGTRQGRRSDLDEAFEVLREHPGSDPLSLVLEGGLRASTWARNHRAMSLFSRRLRAMLPFHGTRRVTVRIGASGTGKTFPLRSIEDAYWKTPNDIFWGGYEGHQTVVFDDYRGGWFRLSTFLVMLDDTPSKVKIYGDQVDFHASTIYITSNKTPLEWYPNATDEEKKALCRRINRLEVYSGQYPNTEITSVDNDNMHDIYNFLLHRMFAVPLPTP